MNYYPVPALMTVPLPRLVFRMGARLTILYLDLAAISAPLIQRGFVGFMLFACC